MSSKPTGDGEEPTEAEDEIVDAFVDLILEDIAAHPDLYGADLSAFGLRAAPHPHAGRAPEPRRSRRPRA